MCLSHQSSQYLLNLNLGTFCPFIRLTFHPLFLRNLIAIIKMTCPACKRFFSSGNRVEFSPRFWNAVDQCLFCSVPADSLKALLVGQLELLSRGLLIASQQLKELVHINDDDDGDAEEAKVMGRSKQAKQHKLKTEKEIEATVERILRDEGQSETERPPPSRHVEHERQMIINEFRKRVTASGKCLSCDGGWKKVMLYKSCIVFILKTGTVSTAMG